MENKRLYDKIIGLLGSNLFEAAKEMSKLDQNGIKAFNLYMSNKVLHEEAARYRGKVIEMSIYLENVLARVLSYYFADEDKREILNSIIFDRMDLQRKLNTLKSLIKVKHPEIWKRKNSKLKEIGKLISFRNNLAHSVLNSTIEYKSKLIKKVKEMERTGSQVRHLDEIELGYFDNHNWIYRSINVDEINQYLSGMYNSIHEIEEIGTELIKGYKKILVNNSNYN